MITTWLVDQQRLPDGSTTRWKPLRMTRHTTPCSAQTLPDALAALGPVTGWLLGSDGLRLLRGEAVTEVSRWLAGELFRDHDSWVLSRQPRDQWTLTHIQLAPATADEADTLGEAVTQLADHADCERLHYWRLWQPDADGLPVCNAAVLRELDFK